MFVESSETHTLSSNTMHPTTQFHANITMFFTITYSYTCCCWQRRVHHQHQLFCFLQVFLSSHSISLVNNVKSLAQYKRTTNRKLPTVSQIRDEVSVSTSRSPDLILSRCRLGRIWAGLVSNKISNVSVLSRFPALRSHLQANG